ncbi:MAG: response regulator [Planctomycetota bacterium]
MTEFALNKDGITIKQVEAAAALGVAEGAHPAGEPGEDLRERRTRKIAESVTTASRDHRLRGKSILWVDDRPPNNTYERRALEALGIRFTLSTSTEDALNRLEHDSFDAIISDMGRPPDSSAGYTLLEALKARGSYPPFVIYSGSNAPEHKREAKERGGWGATNRPQELFEMVLSAMTSHTQGG